MKKAIGLFLVLMTFPALGLADEVTKDQVKSVDQKPAVVSEAPAVAAIIEKTVPERIAALEAEQRKIQAAVQRLNEQFLQNSGALKVLKELK